MAQENNYLKKPISAYIHFCNAMRNSVKEDKPELTPKQILSKLGELWQELKKNGGENLQKYIDMASENKKEFEKQKAENPDGVIKPRKTKKTKKSDVSSEDEKPKPKPKTRTKEKDINTAPPRLNGYIKFLKNKREGYSTENPALTSKQVTSNLATLWKELTDEEKLKWKES